MKSLQACQSLQGNVGGVGVRARLLRGAGLFGKLSLVGPTASGGGQPSVWQGAWDTADQHC